MVLTGAHYIYILFMVAALVTMIMKKESVVPCILGIFTLGLYYNRSLVGALGSVFTALGVALNELGSVIIIIGIMVALSKALEESKSIDFMVGPISKIVKNPTGAFFHIRDIYVAYVLVFLAITSNSTCRGYIFTYSDKSWTSSYRA